MSQTIIDYDRIAVLDHGQLAEYDSPVSSLPPSPAACNEIPADSVSLEGLCHASHALFECLNGSMLNHVGMHSLQANLIRNSPGAIPPPNCLPPPLAAVLCGSAVNSLKLMPRGTDGIFASLISESGEAQAERLKQIAFAKDAPPLVECPTVTVSPENSAL